MAFKWIPSHNRKSPNYTKDSLGTIRAAVHGCSGSHYPTAGECSFSIVQCGLSSHSAYTAQRLRALLARTNSFRWMDINPCAVCRNYCEQGEEGRETRRSGLSRSALKERVACWMPSSAVFLPTFHLHGSSPVPCSGYFRTWWKEPEGQELPLSHVP